MSPLKQLFQKFRNIYTIFVILPRMPLIALQINNECDTKVRFQIGWILLSVGGHTEYSNSITSFDENTAGNFDISSLCSMFFSGNSLCYSLWFGFISISQQLKHYQIFCAMIWLKNFISTVCNENWHRCTYRKLIYNFWIRIQYRNEHIF